MNLSDYGTQLAVVLAATLSAIVTTAVNLWWEERRRKQRERREDAVAERQSLEWVNRQWWDRKATAYTEIIEALWQSVEYSRDYLAHAYGESVKGVDVEHEKFDNYRKNQLNLSRTADVGAFVVSEEASAALQAYFTSTKSAADWDSTEDIAENHLKAGEQCLKEVRSAALRDLRVSSVELIQGTP